jgi:competence ComEA-like helix-hairpin-helix protein
MALSERRLVLVLLALAVVGHLARLTLSRPGEAPGAISLLPAAPSGALQAQRALVERAARPLAPKELIDADRATALDFARLPRIGPVLAKRIVEDRSHRGPFRDLAGLDRVPGIGPSLLSQVEPHLTFSAPPRALAPAPERAGAESELGPSSAVPLNRASALELEALPGIGPTKARAIVAYRELHGPFATLEALTQVRGIGPAVLARLRGQVLVP